MRESEQYKRELDSLTSKLIESGIANNIILITSETYSKFIHKNDKGNQTIFSDGASASLISNKGFAEILNFDSEF